MRLTSCLLGLKLCSLVLTYLVLPLPCQRDLGDVRTPQKKGPHHDESQTFHMQVALVCKLVIAHSIPSFVEAIKGGMDHELFLPLLRGSFIHRSVKTMRIRGLYVGV